MGPSDLPATMHQRCNWTVEGGMFAETCSTSLDCDAHGDAVHGPSMAAANLLAKDI